MRFSFYYKLALYYLAGNFILRLLYSSEIVEVVVSPMWFISLLVGTLNDALIASLFIAIIVGAQTLTANRPRLQIHCLSLLLIISTLLAIIQLLADSFLWYEFSNRSNRLIFHYLSHPYEVMAFLHDQLKIGYWILPLIALLLFGYKKVLKIVALQLTTVQRYSLPKFSIAAVYSLIVGYFFSYFGAVEPLQSRALNQLAGNGLINILHILQVDITDWQDAYPTLTEQAIEQVLSQPPHQPSSVTTIPNIKHVVIIIEESFAGKYWSNPTLRQANMPNFTRWAKRGLLFENAYATGTRTTRGLEAILNGYPPLPGIALNQRPVMSQLPSLPRAFQQNQFNTWFVYSGWPNFSNFSHYWKASGFDNILTRNNFDQSLFQTSWGFADEYLFERIIEVMNQQTKLSKPVFLSALTVSNHRPFDIPDGSIETKQQRTLQNGIRYADYALGNFLDRAARQPWFNETLFVIVADHGSTLTGHASIPMHAFHVPLLLLAPKHLAARQSQQLASIMDIPQTIANIVGLQHQQNFWGSNLLAEPVANYVLVEHEYHLGIFQSNHQLTVLPYRDKPETWQFKRANLSDEAQPIELDKASLKRLNAVMQKAHEALY